MFSDEYLSVSGKLVILSSSSYLEAFLPPWIVIWELVPPCHGGGIQCEIFS
ncbi:hypothetical protein T02_24 [Trichinella nativa]|uniref:Uncharacterized protein n=1 Tax=Trichinella nativa TaxID=6335 RepID=A0A0V1KRW6_9BILA|nr:hypothetical protein T02_24 [Trichinella nativa]